MSNQRQLQIDEVTKLNNDLKRENERKEEEIKGLKLTIENNKIMLEKSQKTVEENDQIIRYLNQNINQASLPFNTMMKQPENFSNLSTLRKHPQFNSSNVFHQEDHRTEVVNTENSYKPYFNSNAFQTQGSIGNLQNINSGNNVSYAKNNEFIMPFTNLTKFTDKNSVSDNLQSFKSNSGNYANYETHSKTFIFNLLEFDKSLKGDGVRQSTSVNSLLSII